MTKPTRPRRPTRPEPLRFQCARAFLESARDMGDPATIATARRVMRALQSPRLHPCSEADMQMFREWCNA